MFFLKENCRGTLKGVLFVALLAASATYIAMLPLFFHLGLSSLVIGIVIGIFYANILHHHFPKEWNLGIEFCGKKILRLAIVLYGFRITFQQIADVGLDGFLISFTMLISTFILGTVMGQKMFKLDRDTAMLTAAGASVCGAAAVLATESVLKSEDYKASIAVTMVVLFGTISMFLYPIMYQTIIEPANGFFHLSPKAFGLYAGGTIHEIAQVVAATFSIPDAPLEMKNSAVIVKMTRVLMIAPMLILLSLYINFQSKHLSSVQKKVKFFIPWFAVYFIVVAGINSLIEFYINGAGNFLQPIVTRIINHINEFDTFLLTMAMVALGMGTRFSKFKGLGLAPLYTALTLFIWLVIGGFLVTKLITSFIV